MDYKPKFQQVLSDDCRYPEVYIPGVIAHVIDFDIIVMNLSFVHELWGRMRKYLSLFSGDVHHEQSSRLWGHSLALMAGLRCQTFQLRI
jgi:hypothetical protein